LYAIDYRVILKWLPQLGEGCVLTVYISVLAMLGGVILGVICGTIHSSARSRLSNLLVTWYVEIFRGTPLLVQLFFIYFGLGQLGVKFTPIVAGVLTLSLNSGAYISEIVRSAISALDRGQYESALSLGMSHLQAMRYVILPQALRIAVPPLVNSFSAILKDSSLVSIIAIAELTRIGQELYTSTYRPFEAYTTLGVMYLVMTLIISRASKVLEVKSKLVG
jgi:polar amino acid transport system permease protein